MDVATVTLRSSQYYLEQIFVFAAAVYLQLSVNLQHCLDETQFTPVLKGGKR